MKPVFFTKQYHKWQVTAHSLYSYFLFGLIAVISHNPAFANTNDTNAAPQNAHTYSMKASSETDIAVKNSHISCPAGYSLPPKEPQLEVILTIDLTQVEDQPASLEFYTVKANEAFELVNGRIKSAENLEVGDLIIMEDGKLGSIQKVRKNYYNPQPLKINSERQAHRRTLGKSKRWTHKVLKIHTPYEVIETTPEHPFFVDKRWINAEYLRAGDKISSAFGEPVPVLKTEMSQALHGGTFVYNLKVEGAENFYVGPTGLLAHNCIPGHCKGGSNCRSKLLLTLFTMSNPVKGFSVTNGLQELPGGFRRSGGPIDDLRIQDKDRIWKIFDTEIGPIYVRAQAEVHQNQLTLNKFSVFPQDRSKSYDLGLKKVMKYKDELFEAVAEHGFESLTINAKRVTGANPGRELSMTFDLNDFKPNELN